MFIRKQIFTTILYIIAFIQPLQSFILSGKKLISPSMRIILEPNQRISSLEFQDSNTCEIGFKLFRRRLPENWILIENLISPNPAAIDWKQFIDSLPESNAWYSYKVEAYNQNESIFSVETTVYCYETPLSTNFSIAYLASLPAHPRSWIESLGDSLYFPEITSTGDTSIVVIDLSDPQQPRIRSYLNPKSLPPQLKSTPIEATLKFNLYGSRLLTCYKGLYFVKKDADSLYCYDSITYKRLYGTQVGKAYGTFSSGVLKGFAGVVSDSCMIFSVFHANEVLIRPVLLRSNIIDTLPVTLALPEWSGTGHYCTSETWGCMSAKAIFITNYSGTGFPGGKYQYYLQDFSFGTSPLTFTLGGKSNLFGMSTSIDSCNALVTKIDKTNNRLTFSTFNILDAQAIESDSKYIRYIHDGFSGKYIFKTIVDKNKKLFIIASDQSISVYSYKTGGNSIKSIHSGSLVQTQKVNIYESPTQLALRWKTPESFSGMYISNLHGKIIYSVRAPIDTYFIWNKQCNDGSKAVPGCYIFTFFNDRFKMFHKVMMR